MKVEKSSFKHLISVMEMSHWKSESLNLCMQKSVCICLYLWHWIWEGVVRLNCLGAWVGRVLQCNTQAWCGRTSCASVCWQLGFAGKLVYLFNIFCSQSKSKSSLLSKEPIARKSFDSPRLKFAKLDDFQQVILTPIIRWKHDLDNDEIWPN